MIKMNEETQNLETLEVEVMDDLMKKDENVDIQSIEVEDGEPVCIKKFDLSEILKPTTKAHQARKVGKVDFAVVNTTGNGKRVKISKELLEELGLKNNEEGTIDIGFTPYGTVVATDLSGIGETFPLSKGGHVYSKNLIEEIIARFNLDFTGVTTNSFSNTEYQKLDNGCVVAIIKM